MGLSIPRVNITNQVWQDRIARLGSMSTPENRMLMGASALMTQPFFDLNNKDVDEDTRKVSCARTISKILVGTATGIAVRTGCINLMERFTRTTEDFEKAKAAGKELKPSKWDSLLAPNSVSKEEFEGATRMLKKHRQALGSIAALGVMLFTNFLVDAPLTSKLTNTINKNVLTTNGNNSANKENGGRA